MTTTHRYLAASVLAFALIGAVVALALRGQDGVTHASGVDTPTDTFTPTPTNAPTPAPSEIIIYDSAKLPAAEGFARSYLGILDANGKALPNNECCPLKSADGTREAYDMNGGKGTKLKDALARLKAAGGKLTLLTHGRTGGGAIVIDGKFYPGFTGGVQGSGTDFAGGGIEANPYDISTAGAKTQLTVTLASCYAKKRAPSSTRHVRDSFKIAVEDSNGSVTSVLASDGEINTIIRQRAVPATGVTWTAAEEDKIDRVSDRFRSDQFPFAQQYESFQKALDMAVKGKAVAQIWYFVTIDTTWVGKPTPTFTPGPAPTTTPTVVPADQLDPACAGGCDTDLPCNLSGTYDARITLVPNENVCSSTEFETDTCTGDGSFIDCRADLTHTTRTLQPLSWRLGCYSDSPSIVINSAYPEASGNTTCPPAPATMCGNGSEEDESPPGCVGGGDPARCPDTLPPDCPTAATCRPNQWVFAALDPTNYPATASDSTLNYYDASDNSIHFGGCFAKLSQGYGPYSYATGVLDAATMEGAFSATVGITDDADCQNGPPFSSGAPIAGSIQLDKLASNVDSLGNPLPVDQLYDGDGDGCPDKKELGSNPTQGGLRDPWNPWDFFNPETANTPHTQTVADILKVVAQYGKNQSNPAYTAWTDRTVVYGGQTWSLGPPDGQETVVDILSAVKQYNHSC